MEHSVVADSLVVNVGKTGYCNKLARVEEVSHW